jgi:hypothetical protein
MGVLGEMFPGRKIRSEAGEAGSGQGWRLGPIDLDADVVEVHRTSSDPEPDPDPDVDPGLDNPDGDPDPDAPPPTIPRSG